MPRDSEASPREHGKVAFGLEKALAVLVALTVIALVAERQILETSFSINVGDEPVAVYDDSGAGGNSASEIVERDGVNWRCMLRAGASHSYCGFEVIFDAQRRQGVDLSNYDTVHLWLDYEGPTDTIRVYLRNFDPDYSIAGQNDTTKYNQVEFDGDRTDGPGPVTFSLKDFFVANWWFQQNRLPPELTHPQFDNVVVLEVQTGLNSEWGEHKFRLEKVAFEGQAISSERWYLGITATWLTVALTFLAFRVWHLKREVDRKSQRERELVAVNRLLDRRGRLLEERAKKDPLTDAFNREGIEEALKEGMLAFRRGGEPLSLIFLDVDHFKAVNDNYGHGVGDQILSGLAQMVQQHIRASDGFARWGGEEFALICRNTGQSDAAALAEKLRVLLSGERFHTSAAVTVSFGVATLKAGEDIEGLFKRADDALYTAKALGRNRVQVAE